MSEMIVGYTHDESIMDKIEGIYSLAEQYDCVSRVKWSMRKRNYRVVVSVNNDGNVDGYLIYAPTERFLGERNRLSSYIASVKKEGIDLTNSTITIFGHIDRSLPDDTVLHNMIVARTNDAKELGYTSTIVNINASPELDEVTHPFCKMKRIASDPTLIPSLVGGALQTLDTLNENGDNVIVHNY